jgi:uncharacterized membrane protein
MYYLIIALGLILYFLYQKGYIDLKSKNKSEDTKELVLKRAKEQYEKGELSEKEYNKIKKDLNDN